MDRETRKALMQQVSYAYYKLLSPKGTGHLTVAGVYDGTYTFHFGASVCAPEDQFSYRAGKFGTENADGARSPGAHARLVAHLQGDGGLLQGDLGCTAADDHNRHSMFDRAAGMLLERIKHASHARKLLWLRSVYEPTPQRPRKKA